MDDTEKIGLVISREESECSQIVPKNSKEYRRMIMEQRSCAEKKIRDKLHALSEKYGFKIEKEACSSLKKLYSEKVPLYVRSPGINNSEAVTGVLFYGRLKMIDGSTLDPCIIYPAGTDYRSISHYSRFTMGGAVEKIEESELILPASIIKQAEKRIEYRMGSYIPLLISIKGEMKYLLPAYSKFFQSMDHSGKDVEPDQYAEPKESEHIKGHYEWGSDMFDDIIICLADLSSYNAILTEKVKLKEENFLLDHGPVSSFKDMGSFIKKAAEKGSRILEIFNQPLGKIPDGVKQLLNLEELRLCNCGIEDLPQGLFKLKKLKKLHLSGNRLTRLPDQIGELIRLEELHLDGNKLEKLPSSIRRLKNLQELWLDNNELAMLPKEIGELKSLEELSVFENKLKVLPAEICLLERMLSLTLSGNELEQLPASFGKMKRLGFLGLSRNRLKSIPENFSMLVKLISLDLQHNQLTDLPRSMTALNREGLEIYLKGNEISKEEESLIIKMLSHVRLVFKRSHQVYTLSRMNFREID
ncbi:MAG: leucine-rich repeat domain-containing protein [Spirochaetes bacterium]|nr:leucine-rich repeat domain-containing protein [Spirochaetota bacterium]